MLFFAHVGLGIALSLIVAKVLSWKDMNIAFVALGTILPDMIDKPFGYLIFGTMTMGRTIAHTLLFLLILLCFAKLYKSQIIASLGLGVATHLALDSMWNMPITLFWPLLGPFTMEEPSTVTDYLTKLIMAMQNPYVGMPEVLGFIFLLFFIRRHWVETTRYVRTLIKKLPRFT